MSNARSTYDEQSSVFNGHYEIELLIDRPVAQVWKQYLNIPSWVTSHQIDYVYGEPGTLGSITRVAFKRAKEEDYPLPHYHFCKLIKVVPERQWLLKAYSEKGGSYGWEMTSFDDGRVVALGDQTKVIFNVYAESIGEAIAKDPDSINLDASYQGMFNNLQNLKRIVESQPRSKG